MGIGNYFSGQEKGSRRQYFPATVSCQLNKVDTWSKYSHLSG